MNDREPEEDVRDEEAPEIAPPSPFGFFTGLVLGALLGAGIALLVAPTSGRVLGRKLRRRFEPARERVGEEVGGLKSQAQRELSRRHRELRQKLPDAT